MFDILNMFSWLKKNFTKKSVLFSTLLITAYFSMRLINLDQFPIFSDEGIYIHWSKVAWKDASWRFISLTDGKQPLQTWGTIPFLKLFPDNALLAGRLFSVSTGFIAMLGMFTLLFYLWGKRAAFIGSLLYIFTPYFLFYDRMALVDSGVNAGFIWMFFFSILLIKTLRLDVALIFGFITGFSLLAKSSARIFLALSALAPIILIGKNIRKSFQKIINYFLLFIISAVLSLLLYNIQRLSPFFHYVAEKNKTFVMTFEEFLESPFSTFFHNSKIIPYYVFSEMAWIPVVFGFIGLVILYKKDRKLFSYFLLWILIPYITIAFFSKVIYPRYLIFFGSIITILASLFLSELKKNVPYYLFYLLLFLSLLYFNFTILFRPPLLPFPEIDRGQYIEGATAAWGAKDIIDYVRMKSREKPAIVLAEGSFGLIGDVLDVFTKEGDKIFIKGYWPLDKQQLAENQKELDSNYVFAVYAQRNEFPSDWPLVPIKKYEKPGRKSTIYLFELRR